MLSHCMNLDIEDDKEKSMSEFKSQALLTNPKFYEAAFGSGAKETVEKSVEWIHPDEGELNDLVKMLQKQQG